MEPAKRPHAKSEKTNSAYPLLECCEDSAFAGWPVQSGGLAAVKGGHAINGADPWNQANGLCKK